MATIIAVSVLQTEELELTHIADALEWIFMLLPNFNLGYGIAQLSANKQMKKFCPLVLAVKVGEVDYCTAEPDHLCCKKCNVFLCSSSMSENYNFPFQTEVATLVGSLPGLEEISYSCSWLAAFAS